MTERFTKSLNLCKDNSITLYTNKKYTKLVTIKTTQSPLALDGGDSLQTPIQFP